MTVPVVAELLARSHRLGADRRNTNYAGGNTSAKGTDRDPVTHDDVELGAFYAQRTILKREVLPEHVAAAVSVLTGSDLSLTTGLHIPVDSGVAAAFLR
jgi:hypothetical protein